MTVTLKPNDHHGFYENDHGVPGLSVEVEADGEGLMRATGTFRFDLASAVARYALPDGAERTPEALHAVEALLDEHYWTVWVLYTERYGGDELCGESWREEVLRYEVALESSDKDGSEDDLLERGFDLTWDWAIPVINEHEPGTFGAEHFPRIVWEKIGSPTLQLA